MSCPHIRSFSFASLSQGKPSAVRLAAHSNMFTYSNRHRVASMDLIRRIGSYNAHNKQKHKRSQFDFNFPLFALTLRSLLAFTAPAVLRSVFAARACSFRFRFAVDIGPSFSTRRVHCAYTALASRRCSQRLHCTISVRIQRAIFTAFTFTRSVHATAPKLTALTFTHRSEHLSCACACRCSECHVHQIDDCLSTIKLHFTTKRINQLPTISIHPDFTPFRQFHSFEQFPFQE
jgi:hypothetical protein